MVKDNPLPNGWKKKRIDDLYHVLGGGTPSTKEPDYWNGNIPWISSADIFGVKDIRPRRRISLKALENSAANLVPAGTLIVVTRVSLGKIAISDYPLCYSQDSQGLIAKDNSVLPNFALYFLSQAVKIFQSISRGTTISGVTKKQLKELDFPLPPLDEQERIVAKIETLFSQLDSGVASLKRIQAALKRYRASVLKAAFEGKLVPQDPADEPAEALLRRLGKVPVEDENLPSLPEGWCWTKLSEIAEHSQKRVHPQSYPKLPYIGLENIEAHTTRLLGTMPSELMRSTADSFSAGDVLYGRLRPYLNKVISPEFEGLCSTEFIVFREGSIIFNKYLLYILNSQKFVSFSNGLNSGDRPRVKFEQLAIFSLPLPPYQEQKRIVYEIEKYLSVIREVEKSINTTLSRMTHLRQSILKQAFEGRLVSQNNSITQVPGEFERNSHEDK